MLGKWTRMGFLISHSTFFSHWTTLSKTEICLKPSTLSLHPFPPMRLLWKPIIFPLGLFYWAKASKFLANRPLLCRTCFFPLTLSLIKLFTEKLSLRLRREKGQFLFSLQAPTVKNSLIRPDFIHTSRTMQCHGIKISMVIMDRRRPMAS